MDNNIVLVLIFLLVVSFFTATVLICSIPQTDDDGATIENGTDDGATIENGTDDGGDDRFWFRHPPGGPSGGGLPGTPGGGLGGGSIGW